LFKTSGDFGNNKFIKKLIGKREEDYYFMLTIFVSIITIVVDLMLVKEFIKIINII